MIGFLSGASTALLASLASVLLTSGCMWGGPPPCEAYAEVQFSDLFERSEHYQERCVSVEGYIGTYHGLSGTEKNEYAFHEAADNTSRSIMLRTSNTYEADTGHRVRASGHFFFHPELVDDPMIRLLLSEEDFLSPTET